MEPFGTNGNLRELADQAAVTGAELPVALVWHAFIQVLEGYGALWRAGLHHGDFHTGNIFLKPSARENSLGYPDLVMGDLLDQRQPLWHWVYSELGKHFTVMNGFVLKNSVGERSRNLAEWVYRFHELEAPILASDPMQVDPIFTPQIMAGFYLQACRHRDREPTIAMPEALARYLRETQDGWTAKLRVALQEIDAARSGSSPVQPILQAPPQGPSLSSKWADFLLMCADFFQPSDNPEYQRMFDSKSDDDTLILSHKLRWFSSQAVQEATTYRDAFLADRSSENFDDFIQRIDIAFICAKHGEEVGRLYMEEEDARHFTALQNVGFALFALRNAANAKVAAMERAGP